MVGWQTGFRGRWWLLRGFLAAGRSIGERGPWGCVVVADAGVVDELSELDQEGKAPQMRWP